MLCSEFIIYYQDQQLLSWTSYCENCLQLSYREAEGITLF